MQVQTSFDPAVQLTPPPIGTPIITYTSAERNDSAVFVPDSSYQLKQLASSSHLISLDTPFNYSCGCNVHARSFPMCEKNVGVIVARDPV